METVTSKDGTRIAFWRSGAGPPVLLVHGASADHSTTWRFVSPLLEQRYTLCAMDRRGRGRSTDSSKYHLLREAEDVAAVVDSIGERVSVIGHSYGGLCAFEAALLTANFDRLILYEAVPIRGADLYPPGVIDRMQAMLEAGDLEGVLTVLFREVVQMPAEELELLRSQSDAWKVRLANAPSLPRELRSEAAYTFIPDRFGSMQTATMLMVGGDSPGRELQNATAVAAALPNARVTVLPGQQHAATYTAPDLFAAEVMRFLDETGPNAA